MEHELECDEYCCASCDGERFQCWLCDKLNAAYRRGREDAAKAVREVIHVPLMDIGGPIKVAKIIDAARGDGNS